MKSEGSINDIMLKLTAAAMLSLCAFAYSSLAASNLFHILIPIPSVYFLLKYRSVVKLPTSAVFLIMFTIVSIVSVFISTLVPNPWPKVGEMRYFLLAIIAIYAYTAVFNSPLSEITKKRMIYLFFISTSLAAVSGLIGLYFGFNPLKFKIAEDKNRSMGLYGMAITYGYGIQMAVMILWGMAWNINWVKKYVSPRFFWTVFALNIIGFYFAFSRGALLGALFGLPFLFLRTKKDLFWKLVLSATLLLTITAGLILLSGSKHRLLMRYNHPSNMERVSLYKVAKIAFAESPWIGHGYRTFDKVSQRIKPKYNIEFPDVHAHAHNNYVEFFVDTGIFGGIFYLLFNVFWILEMWWRRDVIGDTMLGLVIAFSVAGLFQCTIIDAENTFVIMFLYGLSHVFPNKLKLPVS